MAVIIRYTHGWNLLYKIVLWIASLALLMIAFIPVAGALLQALEPIWTAIQDAGVSLGIPKMVFSIIGVMLTIATFLAVIAIGTFVLIQLMVKTVLRPELPTYLYVRLSLLTPISWKEARDLSFLFEGEIWYPLRELRRVPRELRHDLLMEFAEHLSWSEVLFHRQRQAPPRSASPPPPPRVEDPRITVRRKAYQTLGVLETASADEIKSAYRRLMKKYHPDVYAHSQPELKQFAEEKAKALNAAYTILKGANE